jgi:YYY domain-containing protein
MAGLLVATPATLGLIKIDGETVFLALLTLFFLGFLCWDSKDFAEKLKACFRCEAVFWGIFFAFLLIRAFNPEIFWGEKPMNFSFLNFFIRTDSLPPTDPWASDQAMSYYYFGSFMLALIHRIGSIDSTFGYAFCIATNAAFFGSLIYGIFRMHGLGVRIGLIAAGALLFAGNLEILRLIFVDNRAINFDTFWASTRLFTSPNFSEFPLWTYTFGDVHAHNIHLPFTIATLMLLSASFTEPLYSKRVGLWALTGALLGSFVISNTWDVVTYFFVVVCFFVASNHPLKRRIASLFVMGFFAAALYAPFLVSFLGGNQQAHAGIADNAFNTVPQLFFFFGYPALFGLLVYPWNEVKWTAWFKYVFLVLPLALTFLFDYEFGPGLSHVGFSIISGILIWLAIQSQDRLQRAAYLSCGLILFLTEHFTFMDRMNTIFKGYLPLGILLWIGVWGRSLRGGRVLRALAVIPLFFALVSGGVTIAGILRDSKTPGPRPTLYGDDYLWVVNEDEAKLIQWMRDHIPGTPAVLEAFGNYYGPFTRITMHTGLPSYLGWEHHTVQRGVYHPLVIRRRDMIPTFYNTTDPLQALSILEESRVDYFVVSRLERETYKAEGGLTKFDAHPELFIPMARFGDATLYTTFVSRRDFNPRSDKF